MLRVIIYVSAIIMANIVTASFHPLSLGLFIVPVGTFLIGIILILRDYVQLKYGRKNTYLIILGSLVLSAISSHILGDTLWIVAASTAAFAVSETIDTELFTRMKKSFLKRMLYSALYSGILDSAIFVVLGLSPIGANFLPWNMVGYAILGQVVVKAIMQFICVGTIRLLGKKGN